MAFSENLVERDAAGKFAEKAGSVPEVALSYPHGTSLPEKYEELHTRMAALYKSEEGRTRVCYFVGDDIVVKVPTDEEGLDANYVEALWSENHGKDGYIPIADSAIETWGELDVLVMERIEPVIVSSYKDFPEWVGSVDCAQVGYDSEGRLVAYDL